MLIVYVPLLFSLGFLHQIYCQVIKETQNQNDQSTYFLKHVVLIDPHQKIPETISMNCSRDMLNTYQ